MMLDSVRSEGTTPKTIYLKGDLTQDQKDKLLEIAERCPVNQTLTTECHVVGKLG